MIVRTARIAIGAIAMVLLAGCGGVHHGHHASMIVHDDVRLDDGQKIAGDLNIVNSHVVCDDATIEGEVHVYFGEFEQTGKCAVHGTVTNAFDGDQAFVFAPWLAPDDASRHAAEAERALTKCAYGIIVLIMFLLFPRRTRTALDRVEHHPGLAAVLGTMLAVAAIPIAVILAITIVGLPLILLELAGLFAMLWIGEAAVALLIGRRFYELVRPHTTPPPLGALVVGLVLITAAEFLPVVGWAVWAIVSLIGIGCASMAFIEERRFVSFARPGDGGPGTGSGGSNAPIGPGRGTPPGPGVPMRTP